MTDLISSYDGWSCPNCGCAVSFLSDVYNCMFGDAVICIGCYVQHNEKRHRQLYEGSSAHKTCSHGFPLSGKCGPCKRA